MTAEPEIKERTLAWETAILGEIHRKKVAEKSDDRDNLLELTSRHLYGEKIHYALELIQNAEDEGASTVTFIFDEHQAMVVNDGQPFSPDDVWGICSVRTGRKANKIGFYGVGFKSVYTISELPQVISGPYNFTIQDKIYPAQGPELSERAATLYMPDRGAIFCLPYAPGQQAEKLVDHLHELDARLLLFMESVRCIRLVDHTRGIQAELRREETERGTVLLHNEWSGAGPEEWRVFSRPIPVTLDPALVPERKADVRTTRITIAIPAAAPSEGTAHVVYCYLPTQQRTGLPFLIQGDFISVLNRESLEDNHWNKWLLDELGAFAADVVDSIRAQEAGTGFFDWIPSQTDVTYPVFQPLFNRMQERLRRKAIAPSVGGDWMLPELAAFSRDHSISGLISESDLEQLVRERRRYVPGDLPNRTLEILEELGARHVTVSDVVDLAQRFDMLMQKRRNPKWFLKLYDFLARYFGSTPDSTWSPQKKVHFEAIAKAQLLLTANSDLVIPRDSNHPARLVCYPAKVSTEELYEILTAEELVIIHPYFQTTSVLGQKRDPENDEGRDRVKRFFSERLNVRLHFKPPHVIRHVLIPKFETGKFRDCSPALVHRYVDYIRRNYKALVSELRGNRSVEQAREEIGRDLGQTIYLEAEVVTPTGRVREYLHPTRIYFGRGYGHLGAVEDLLGDIHGAAFLTGRYRRSPRQPLKQNNHGRRRDTLTYPEFLKLLGVWSAPQVHRAAPKPLTYGSYDWIERRFSTRGHQLINDHESPHLEGLFDRIAEETPERAVERMTILWSLLSRNWNSKYRAFCSSEYHTFYYSEYRTRLSTSTFLQLLRESQWVPTTASGLTRPSDAYLATDQNSRLLGNSAPFIALNGPKAYLEALRVPPRPSLSRVLDRLKQLQVDPDARPTIRVLSAIYAFLGEELTTLSEDEAKQLRNRLESEALIYLPRSDRQWWAPSVVFWQDHERIFGNTRGYIEYNGQSIYPSALKEAFEKFGVANHPEAVEYLEYLEELDGKAPEYQSIASLLFLELNDLQDVRTGLSFGSELRYLSTMGAFLPADELYVDDAFDTARALGAEIDILWLPFPAGEVPHFILAAGFPSLREHAQVQKVLNSPKRLDAVTEQHVWEILQATERYLERTNPRALSGLRERPSERMRGRFSIAQADRIRVTLGVERLRDGAWIERTLAPLAFWSEADYCLYLSPNTMLHAPEAIEELAGIYDSAASAARLFLESVTPSLGDADAIRQRLHDLGVDPDWIPQSKHSVVVEILPEGNEGEPESEARAHASAVGEQLPATEPEKPQVKIKSRLVDPDAIEAGEEVNHHPYSRNETATRSIVAKPVSLKSGTPPTGKSKHTPTWTLSPATLTVEDVALRMALRREDELGNAVEDRHLQRKIGYDIYSRTPAGEEYFIEVKSFQGPAGTLRLEDSEWHKAEIERDRYLLYVFAHLDGQQMPQLHIIQDPIQFLTPDPPKRKHISSWQAGVAKTITYRDKASSEEQQA